MDGEKLHPLKKVKLRNFFFFIYQSNYQLVIYRKLNCLKCGTKTSIRYAKENDRERIERRRERERLRKRD